LSPEQFLAQVRRQPPPSVVLFLGPETYHRSACRQSLLERILGSDQTGEGFVRHSLDEVTLAEVIDDARSYSLFAPKRLIWVSRAEAALPKGKAVTMESDEDDRKAGSGDAGILADYLRDPTPDVVLVFDSSRFEFDGDDKARSERVRKFYSAIPNVVEFPRFDAEQSRRLAQALARETNVRIGSAELDLLVEAVGSSATAIRSEIEKLYLFAGDRPVTAADIARLVPQARVTTIFALVAALGRKDRTAALEHLDSLVREGEYLPLALAFLSTQFRQALVAKEFNLRSVGQILAHFNKAGIPMWPARAEQIQQTVSAFSADQMRSVLIKIAAADRNLRDARPDDRTL
jgi:DNA polymerase-3 subunit delta